MRLILGLLGAVLSVTALHGATIQVQTTLLGFVNGQSVYRSTYIDTDTPLLQNQALEIEFNPTQYGVLSNPLGPQNFDLLLIQPNNPPGLPGLFSALALTNTAAPVGPFSVDFVFLGLGAPGVQQFFITAFDAQGSPTTITSGTTTFTGPTAVPEPGSLALGSAALLAGLVWRSVQSRRRR